MTIIIAAQQQVNMKLLLGIDQPVDHEIIWVPSILEFDDFDKVDAVVDLDGGTMDFSHIRTPLLINSTSVCLSEIITANNSVARFCAWPGFIEKDTWEVAVATTELSEELLQVFKALHRQYSLVADSPGFIAPRILSMIINEACYALYEGITDATQIDVAMKLGTNYPEGPIEWGRRIGPKPIIELLEALSKKESRYKPHPSIQKFLS